MADQIPEAEAPKTIRKTTKDAAPDGAALAAPEAAPAVSEAAPDGAPRLRYTGPAPVIVMDLGGEIVPDQVVRVLDPEVASSLLARGDFEMDS